jgi:hypothetical protein
MTSIEQLIEGISKLYASSPQDAARTIEDYLDAQLKELTLGQRIATVQELDTRFLPVPGNVHSEKEVIDRVIRLVLGRNPGREDLSSPEILERLALSLNTIFDIVNQLIGVINTTFATGPAGDETIRQVIGENMEGQSPAQPLEDHLGQIKKAFLITQQAFKIAASSVVDKILAELDPQNISSRTGSSLKFGPLKKAESFDLYEESFHKFKQWYESGRFMEDFLREFEKNCQKLFVS